MNQSHIKADWPRNQSKAREKRVSEGNIWLVDDKVAWFLTTNQKLSYNVKPKQTILAMGN